MSTLTTTGMYYPNTVTVAPNTTVYYSNSPHVTTWNYNYGQDLAIDYAVKQAVDLRAELLEDLMGRR